MNENDLNNQNPNQFNENNFHNDQQFNNNEQQNFAQNHGFNNFAANNQFIIKGNINRVDAETYIRWGKIFGIINIIIGALLCLTCFGAIVGVPYIFAGLRLQKSAQALERAVLIGDENSVSISFHELSRAIRIFGIMALIGIILQIIGLIIFIILGMAAPALIRDYYSDFYSYNDFHYSF